jgi:hypothetical protein
VTPRIKELAHEAGLLVHNPEGAKTKLEHFVSLIAAEMVAITQQVQKDADFTHTPKRAELVRLGAKIVEDRINRRFGVKE